MISMQQAKRNLEKYGWKEGLSLLNHTRILQAVLGKGLGKDEDGITQAIKVPLKKDTAGVLVIVCIAMC